MVLYDLRDIKKVPVLTRIKLEQDTTKRNSGFYRFKAFIILKDIIFTKPTFKLLRTQYRAS